MSLLEQIQIAQRNAGEDAVIANLERMGLAPKPQFSTEQLTAKFAEICGGQVAGCVVGAGLNITMTALQQLPKELAAGAAAGLRSMADQLDTIASGDRH